MLREEWISKAPIAPRTAGWVSWRTEDRNGLGRWRRRGRGSDCADWREKVGERISGCEQPDPVYQGEEKAGGGESAIKLLTYGRRRQLAYSVESREGLSCFLLLFCFGDAGLKGKNTARRLGHVTFPFWAAVWGISISGLTLTVIHTLAMNK